MSTAAAVEASPAPAKSKKKLLIIIIAAAVVVLGGGGAGAYFMLKKSPEAVEAEGEGDAAEHDSHAPAKAGKSAKKDASHAPVFVPLEPFTVNLADREAERYAQIGITLEIEDAKVGDEIKTYMPAIRNNILMAIADRTAGDLMGREGKAQLAARVIRETSRALGHEVEDEPAEAAADEEAPKKPAKKKKKSAEPLPVKAVHFSNFIIQ